MLTAIAIAAFIAFLLAIVLLSLLTLRHFGIWAPLYVQTVQATNTNINQKQLPVLSDARHRFVTQIQEQIAALPLSAQEKEQLYKFILRSDDRMSNLMCSERIPVSLFRLDFGTITVTFRLKLREFSRQNLDRLMKMENLMAQALSVESVRMNRGAGFIDCEIPTPIQVRVGINQLLSSTHNTEVAVGVDTNRMPQTIDISQHGLIATIGPSRRGKTQAVKTMLYLLKRTNPTVNIVVCAFKSMDWQAFGGTAALIFESDELKRFQVWLLQTMYAKAKTPSNERWVIVFDDLVNLLSVNPELTETVKQCASLGAGVGVTTIASTQFTGKDSGGVAVTANATARIMFKPSSTMQGARDGGMAGLGLDQLSTQKGDALLVVDGDSQRIATSMVQDCLIEQLPGRPPIREWLRADYTAAKAELSTMTMHPFEQYIEQLNGYILDNFNFEEGKFGNRTDALRRLGWSNNGRMTQRLSELEQYIFDQAERYK